MRRVLAFLIVLALLVAASVWMADRPGAVTVQWLGWRVDTSVPVLLLFVVAIVGIFWLLLRLGQGLRAVPRRIAASRRERRRRKGYLALINGMTAVAAGDARLARRHARLANQMLDEPPLTQLLTAQAAQLDGDRDTAARHYSAMLERPETRLLGLRGLLDQALAAGDRAAALDHARRAHALSPDADWLTRTLLDLQIEAGQWREAQDTLTSAARHNALPAADLRRKRAIVLGERAALAAEDGDLRAAVRFARQAVEAEPGLVPATVRLADYLGRLGKIKAARNVVERAWEAEPHPDLAAAYLALWPQDDPLARVRRAEQLAARRPGHPESHILVGEQALLAQLWGQARHHLGAAVEQRPSPHAYRLLARVEEQDGNSTAAARDWLAKAAEAAPDPIWLCRACGGAQGAWTAHCAHCHGFDSLSWTRPPAPVRALPSPRPPTLEQPIPLQ